MLLCQPLGGYRLSLSDTEKFSVAIGKRVLDKELVSDGSIPVYSANVAAPFGFIDKLLITDFSAPSVLWGIDGDWMTSYLPSDMPFYPTDHCGVLRCKTSEVNPRYLAHLLEVEGGKWASLGRIVLPSTEYMELHLLFLIFQYKTTLCRK